MKSLTVFGLLALAGLYGCKSNPGGDTQSSAQTPPSSPEQQLPANSSQQLVGFEGIWQGIVTPDVSGTSSPALVMVNGWGELRLLTDERQFVGFPARTAKFVAGTLTGIRSAATTWHDGSVVSDFFLSGSIDDDAFIDATYSGSVESGTLQLSWAADRVVNTEIDEINGVWALYDDNQNIRATLQIGRYDQWQAQISGFHTNGCVYFGNTEAWTSFYSYDVVPFEISGCPNMGDTNINGTYSGTAALVDIDGDNSEDHVLVFALTNSANQLALFLHRVSD